MSPPQDDGDRTVHQPRTVPLSSGSVHTPVTTPGQTHGAAGGAGHHSLPLGTRLGEFELTKEIGEGGFSIVYLAWDHSLDRNVALKEYMPSSIAARSGPTEVGARSERHRETFDAGLKSFINEAKLLARFDHPALVKVYRFWEANGTAYMVMPFYEGKTVKDTVRALPAPPDEAWLRGLLGPLTEALNVIHAEHCYHRDIAPDNVILLAGSSKPLLLDFGAARRVIGDMTQALTVILKPGYAPVEQYAEVPGMKQGPWTDVYALAAVVYWAITGKTPPTSVGRMLSDTYVPLLECAAGPLRAAVSERDRPRADRVAGAPHADHRRLQAGAWVGGVAAERRGVRDPRDRSRGHGDPAAGATALQHAQAPASCSREQPRKQWRRKQPQWQRHVPPGRPPRRMPVAALHGLAWCPLPLWR